MSCYNLNGVKISSSTTLKWDRVRNVKLKDGNSVTRCELIICEGMQFNTPGLGMITENDIGRVLVVDIDDDGYKVDTLCTFPPSKIDEIKLGGLQAMLKQSELAIKEAQATYDASKKLLDEYIKRNRHDHG